MPDGGLHGLQQQAQPALHLAHAHPGLREVHILLVLAVHPNGLFGRLFAVVQSELELGHAVKQLGQVAGYLGRGGGGGGREEEGEGGWVRERGRRDGSNDRGAGNVEFEFECSVQQRKLRPHLHWLVALGQDVQQVSRGDEVESGEGQPLGLQVLCQSLLTHRQPLLDVLQVLVEVRTIGGLDHVWSGHCLGCQHLSKGRGGGKRGGAEGRREGGREGEREEGKE